MQIKIKDKNLYYVGGAVRDEILGIANFDVDLCYEGNALEFAKNFNIIKKNTDLGTVRILFEQELVDIASTRTELYPKCGHLPVIKEIGCPLKKDLIRRDFTINALAKNTVTEEIVDYFDGINDLKNKKLRVLHEKSFIEDPTRIIRGLKFSVRLGFELDSNTKQLQDDYLNNINYNMSYHRLKKELIETFNLNKLIILNNFIDQNIYKLLNKDYKIPNISINIESLVDKYKPKHTWLVYLGGFNLTNLELSSEERKIIDDYHKIKNKIPNSDIESYSCFKNIELESILLYASTVNYDIAINYLDNLKDIKPLSTGADLINIGIKPGQIYSEIFNYIIEMRIKDKNLTKEEEIEIIKRNYL